MPSAHHSAVAVASAVSAGAGAYLLKPFATEQLAAVVERAQGRRGL